MFDVQSDLEKHLQEHLKCPKCGSSFKSIKTLKIHCESNICEESFSCEHCGNNFSQKSTLRLHISRTHFVKCQHCQKRFDSDLELFVC